MGSEICPRMKFNPSFSQMRESSIGKWHIAFIVCCRGNCSRTSYLKKWHAVWLQTYQKKNPATDIFLSKFFKEHPWTALILLFLTAFLHTSPGYGNAIIIYWVMEAIRSPLKRMREKLVKKEPNMNKRRKRDINRRGVKKWAKIYTKETLSIATI